MQISPLETPDGTSLYEAVAARVEWLIENETLRPGDRIPSVRRMHQQLAVSISTVMQAYRVLENRGLIEARPQSGYYVRRSLRQDLEEPVAARPPPFRSASAGGQPFLFPYGQAGPAGVREFGGGDSGSRVDAGEGPEPSHGTGVAQPPAYEPQPTTCRSATSVCGSRSPGECSMRGCRSGPMKL